MELASVTWGTWAVTKRLLQALFIVLALAYTFQRYLVFPRHISAAMNGVPSPIEGADLIEIHTEDGETLAGYWHPPEQGMPTIVTFHGNGSSPIPHAQRFATAPWSTYGWGFLAIAYRGYPGSTGSPSEQGLISDAKAAIAYAKGKAPNSPIVLHGHSLGTGVALAVAGYSKPMALILEAAYTSLVDVAWSSIPVLPILLWDTFPANEWIKAVEAPIEIVHGDADSVIPIRLARELAQSKPGTVMTVVQGGDHVSIFGSQDTRIESELRSLIPAHRWEFRGGGTTPLINRLDEFATGKKIDDRARN